MFSATTSVSRQGSASPHRWQSIKNRLIWLLILSFTPYVSLAADFRFHGIKPAVIIDVRTPQEFASGHIDGAVNIPYDQIGKSIDSLKGVKKDSPILLYCRSGRRSAIARSVLDGQGFSQTMDGGAMTSLMQNLKTCTANVC